MTGMELINLAAFDLRDHASLTGASHTLYPIQEKLARLKSALRFLAAELARERYGRMLEEWETWAYSDYGWIDLLPEFMAVIEVYISGREVELGPLRLAAREDRYSTLSDLQTYSLINGAIRLSPAFSSDTMIRLVVAPWPELCLQPEPANDQEAEAQLAVDLPGWAELFVESLKQFIVLSCANRNEYDTSVEQGLFQMLKTAAAEAASLEGLDGLDKAAPGGLWTGESY